MRLSNDLVQPFVGGQASVQDAGGSWWYHGKIEAIIVSDNQIRIEFAWVAKAEDQRSRHRSRWVRIEMPPYCGFGCDRYLVRKLEALRRDQDGDCLFMVNPTTAETITLYPPGCELVDEANIEDL